MAKEKSESTDPGISERLSSADVRHGSQRRPREFTGIPGWRPKKGAPVWRLGASPEDQPCWSCRGPRTRDRPSPWGRSIAQIS